VQFGALHLTLGDRCSSAQSKVFSDKYPMCRVKQVQFETFTPSKSLFCYRVPLRSFARREVSVAVRQWSPLRRV